MEIPTKYYDRNIYGIDPRTVVAGFRAPAGMNSTEAQQGTRRFIANDWDRTGSYILVANTIEFMKRFFLGETGHCAWLTPDGTMLQHYSDQIRRGDTALMEYGVGGAVHYMYEQETEVDGEPLHPKGHCMDGPFVTANSEGIPILDPENPGLWLKFRAESYVLRDRVFGALYDRQGKIYVPTEKQPYLQLKP